jgi:uncharacterized protein (TIGR03382 family)
MQHRRAVTLACLSLALTGGIASANTLRLNNNSFTGGGGGGEFTATTLTGNAGVVGLPGDLAPTTFETFCVERDENFRSGDTYNFAINTGAVQGGVAGEDPPGSGFDPLDPRTAYLYYFFRMGTLSGFDYSPAGRQASSAALQQAIWFIEQEGGTNNAFVALAQAAVSSGNWTGIGSVRVLNLSNNEFPNAQDQLTLISTEIPTPGSAALAALAMAGLARRRRN